jgi:hypothetical protein
MYMNLWNLIKLENLVAMLRFKQFSLQAYPTLPYPNLNLTKFNTIDSLWVDAITRLFKLS